MANPIKIKARLSEMKSVGEGAYYLKFETTKRLPKFKAGQFTHLTVDEFNPADGFWPESRVFSIGSSPKDRKQLEIVYSVKGEYTSKMEKVLTVGKDVWLKLPYGDFIVENCLENEQEAVFIAGGTGVSPFVPYLMEYAGGHKLFLAYGLRSADYLLFRDTLGALKSFDKCELNFFLENTADSKICSELGKVDEGQISIPVILEKVKDFSDPVFFLSGPPAMIKSFKVQLIASGIDSANIKIDEWG